MSATVKQRITAATELWRVAETGDVDGLDRIFVSEVDVNARNKHGVTALMRAACHGHERMVRALLKRGADPNVTRNDRFTALALAAFFGHIGTVRILIEHGARTDVITRCGASAQTWANVRTFAEVASCLASHTPAPVRAPAPVPASVPAPAPAASVRTLKDPPEIWDLVHEVPRGFNAGSAFVSRLTSMKAKLALRIAAGVLVSAACVVGVLVLKGSQARSLPAEPSVNQPVAVTEVSGPLKGENTDTATTSDTPSAPETAEFSHHSEAPIANDKPLRKVNLYTRQTRSRSVPVEEPVQVVESREEVPVAPPVTVASPQVERRNSNKPGNPLSPQLISPTTNTPPKAKVIQWP